jgi:hypothetical protein
MDALEKIAAERKIKELRAWVKDARRIEPDRRPYQWENIEMLIKMLDDANSKLADEAQKKKAYHETLTHVYNVTVAFGDQIMADQADITTVKDFMVRLVHALEISAKRAKEGIMSRQFFDENFPRRQAASLE